ncbi:SHOCT domain-containing protein [Nocardia sp. NPDC058497]|uniref:SHOCT domain-containing protein n=1 Tax=Nocardia sp. NPDC058497 TaxID=3346529 RepID=UPI00365275C5
MPLRRGRIGRPGLLGTMARTAVITGTATAPPVDLVGKLRQLSELHSAGALSDAEFAAAKKQLLG